MKSQGSSFKYPIFCILVILVLSYAFVWLASTDDFWLHRFNYVMFIPAPVAAVCLLLQTKNWRSLLAPISRPPKLKPIAFSILYPVLIIFSCTLLALLLGFASLDLEKIKAIHIQTPIQLIWAIGFLFGEEYAWRGYLLPAFSKKLGYLKSAIIVGFVWALWHGPLVYLLASRLNTWDSPLTLSMVQMFVVLIFSFPFAYAYQLSKSVIPPMIMHYIWNWLNPEILGNIYRNQAGVVKGNIFLINGEGVLGALLGLIFAFWYVCNRRNKSPQ